MKRVAMVCAALGSVLAMAGCSGSSTNSSGGAGTGAGGAGTAAGGTGQTVGGTTGSTGGGFSSTVSGSQVLGNLSDADANTLCMELGKSAELKSIFEFECRTSAVLAAFLANAATDAALQAACQSSYDTCVAAPTVTMCDQKPSAACLATVAEYETCLKDEAAQVSAASAQLPMCSALQAATLMASLNGLPQSGPVASCATVQQKCPEFGSDGGMM